ncbi:MAG: HesA/MoeB/ThiF family protein [Deltaproteobacteria bacterium]|nr:HesA/MoeB/ThiF family protein [Deltaproteobacteria bacterium]MBW2661610.1 HesA/MoeB/ThiF family protein [Deltaproteobacteria bacterium]
MDASGREALVLEDAHALKIAKECGCKVYEVYLNALKEEICPCRYIRNRETISLKEQLRLAESRVVVIGAGGLGGQVVLLLARIGIGHLVVVDRDVFEETNLNRQALCNKNTLGKSKAKEALASVEAVNPGVKVSACSVKLDSSNAFEMLSGSDVIVDGLDNVSDRFILEGICKKLGIPLVHGALAGFEGRVMTIFPDDPGLMNLYGSKRTNKNSPKSPESVFGIPAMTPCLIASLQAMEVFKIILKRGKIFKNAMLYVDLETGQMNEFVFEKQ